MKKKKTVFWILFPYLAIIITACLAIAAVIITIVPSIVVYIWLHRHIMEGMVAGAVKG